MAHSLQSSRLRIRQAGLSLIELMVGITISMFLLAGLVTLIAQQSGARYDLDRSARQIESGRYALTLLQDDIEHAGYLGQYGGTLPVPAVQPDPCATDAVSVKAALVLPVQGYDAPAVVPAPLSACLADANHVPGTDILVIRRLETGDVLPLPASAVPGQIYFQATPSDIRGGIGPDVAGTPQYTLVTKNLTVAAELRRYIEHIYFVSPCNRFAAGATTCTSGADNGKPVPTLKRLEMSVAGGVPAFVVTPLADGIENLQIDYGVDAIGSGAPAAPFLTSPATLKDWQNVMAVQVSLLARTTDSSGSLDSTLAGKTYSMGLSGNVGPFSDKFKRHVYTGYTRVVNPSGRRE